MGYERKQWMEAPGHIRRGKGSECGHHGNPLQARSRHHPWTIPLTSYGSQTITQLIRSAQTFKKCMLPRFTLLRKSEASHLSSSLGIFKPFSLWVLSLLHPVLHFWDLIASHHSRIHVSASGPFSPCAAFRTVSSGPSLRSLRLSQWCLI